MNASAQPQQSLIRRLAWLAWNKLWVLIAIAWVVLIAWAMRSAMTAGTQTAAPATPPAQEQGAPTPPPSP